MSRRRVVGIVVAVASVAALGAGAWAAVASTGGAHLDVGAHGSYRTGGYAVATEGTDWRSEFLGWVGSVRLEVAAAGGKPIFVGVGDAPAVGRLLSDTAYTTIGEHTRTDHAGGAPRGERRAVAWAARAEGTGTQTLRWHANGRRQIAIAMNADGSRDVHVRVVSSAVALERMPWWVSGGLFALGVVLLGSSAALLRRA